MTMLPLVLIAGLLGSSHCLGMCGPFAIAIGGGAPGWRDNLLRQLVYTAGRIFTYAVLGAVAGSAGLFLRTEARLLINTAALLAVVAGGFLLYQGVLAAGLLRPRASGSTVAPCLAGDFMRSLLRAPGHVNVFLAGLFTGLIPCGLVYGFVALAASTGDLLAGASLMAAFGAGTAPLMIATGCGSSLLSLRWRRHLLRVAAWCVIVTGLLSIARGAGFLEVPGWATASGCPFCE